MARQRSTTAATSPPPAPVIAAVAMPWSTRPASRAPRWSIDRWSRGRSPGPPAGRGRALGERRPRRTRSRWRSRSTPSRCPSATGPRADRARGGSAPTSSAARCVASAALPPLPMTITLPPACRASMPSAASAAVPRASAGSAASRRLASRLSAKRRRTSPSASGSAIDRPQGNLAHRTEPRIVGVRARAGPSSPPIWRGAQPSRARGPGRLPRGQHCDRSAAHTLPAAGTGEVDAPGARVPADRRSRTVRDAGRFTGPLLGVVLAGSMVAFALPAVGTTRGRPVPRPPPPRSRS
jgi:hypothetical protein